MKSHPLLPIFFCLCTSLFIVFGLLLGLDSQNRQVYAASNDYFAAATGGGSACTQANPCLLDTALALAVDGTTIYVAAGSYTSANPEVIRLTASVHLLGGWDGVPTGAITRNPQAYASILDGEDARRVVYIEKGSPVIDGFTITRGYATQNGGGFYVENGNPIISTNVITDNYGATYGSAVYASANGSKITVVDNIIKNNETPYGGTLIFSNYSRGEVHRNLFEGNQAGYGSAVHTDMAVFTVTHNIAVNTRYTVLSLNRGTGVSQIINNLFYDNPDRLGQYQNANHSLILHNTFAHCANYVALVNYSSVITYTNNIATDCKNDSLFIDGTSTVTGTNNLFWNNKANPHLLNAPLVADPRFIDPASGNYQLGFGSPAVDYGSNAGITEDLLGAPRPIGPASDVGAFERLATIYLPLLFRK